MLLVFAFLALAQSPQAASRDPGRDALQKRDYQTAEQIFAKAVADNPKDYYSLFNLALAEVGLKQDVQAAAHFKQTLGLKPGLYEAELNLGILYLRDRRDGDAVPLLQSALLAKPDEARTRLFLAQALLGASRWADAATNFEEVLKLNPNDALAQLGLGRSLLHQSKLDQAMPHYQKAAALDAGLKSYLLELAVALVDAKRTPEAIPLLQQFPEDPGAREKLGQIYLDAKQPALAVPEFEAAAAVSPTQANRLALATAYLRNQQDDKAAPLLENALAASPNDYDLRMVVARLYRDQKNYPRAITEFSAAAKLKPAAAEAWSELAGLYVLMNDYGPALDALDQIHRLNAEKPGHYFLRAIVLDKLHQLKPAIASYAQFLATSKGANPDQEFQARQRIRILGHEVNGR